jgi:hypothetical protein
MATHDQSREERLAGADKPTIIGNWKWIVPPAQSRQAPRSGDHGTKKVAPDQGQGEIPF